MATKGYVDSWTYKSTHRRHRGLGHTLCSFWGGADFLLVRLDRWLKIFITTDNLNRHNPFLSITEPFVEHLIGYTLLYAALGLPLGSSKNCSIETPFGSPSNL